MKFLKVSLEDILKLINKSSSNKITKTRWYPIHDFHRNLEMIHQIVTILLLHSDNEKTEHSKCERNQRVPRGQSATHQNISF